MLRFYLWKPFYFNGIDNYLPSDTNEVRGRFVGISENVGHDMTFNTLNSSTNKIINRSAVRPAGDGKAPNLRAEPLASHEAIKYLHDDCIPLLKLHLVMLSHLLHLHGQYLYLNLATFWGFFPSRQGIWTTSQESNSQSP